MATYGGYKTPQEKLLAVAAAQIGYREKASNASLDDFTANAGGANYQKFARDLDALGDFYNTKKNGFDWCDIFADWCHVEAFGEEVALKTLRQPKKSAGAGVYYSASYYKQAGAFYTSNPQPGDQIFFYGDTIDIWQHTGIFEKQEGNWIYTIEGNTGTPQGVHRMKYAANYSKIAGYGRPNWSAVQPDPEKAPEKAESRPTVDAGEMPAAKPTTDSTPAGSPVEAPETRYNSLDEIKAGFPWAYDTIKKLVDAGKLSGTGTGLDLSTDMLRLLTVIDRAVGL